MYPCRREVLEHSFRLSVPLQRKIIDTSIDNERTAAGKWAGRFGYVQHDVISRKTKNRKIKIRQLESETNPPNLIPAKFSGYTVLKCGTEVVVITTCAFLCLKLTACGTGSIIDNVSGLCTVCTVLNCQKTCRHKESLCHSTAFV